VQGRANFYFRAPKIGTKLSSTTQEHASIHASLGPLTR